MVDEISVPFTYIRNRISDYKKNDLLEYAFNILSVKQDGAHPFWVVFTLIKWIYLYGGKRHPSKNLTQQKFAKIYNSIVKLTDDHIISFMKGGSLSKAFQVIYHQQFYLQLRVPSQVFSAQLKLYKTITGQYDIDQSFEEKAGISIFDYLNIQQLVWLYVNVNPLNDPTVRFNGVFSKEMLRAFSDIIGKAKMDKYFELLTMNPIDPVDSISNFRRSLTCGDLQTLEPTFFTLYPFLLYRDELKLIHKSVFNHTSCYFIHDYMKSNDEKFTAEFGRRFEKYIKYGLNEVNYNYLIETQIQRMLPPNSKVVDYCLPELNVYLECKAIELQSYTSINPTDELLYNSLKGSILKAYFEQLLNVAMKMTPNEENWGIILTYKELYWSSFKELFDVAKDKFPNSNNSSSLPPENVFIIDIFTWDAIIQIIKNKKATLVEILQVARANNLKPETAKLSFSMHLEIYKLDKVSLSFLDNEYMQLRQLFNNKTNTNQNETRT